MNAEFLLDAIGLLEDGLLADAEELPAPRRPFPLRRLTGLAACLTLTAVLGYAALAPRLSSVGGGAAPAAGTEAEAPAAPEKAPAAAAATAPEFETGAPCPEESPAFSSQQAALDACEELLSRLADLSDPTAPLYPPEWGGAYCEDGLLHVNLVSPTPELEELYRGRVSDPSLLVFHPVEHSLRELQELMLALCRLDLPAVSSVGVDERQNRVELAVTEEAGQWELLCQSLGGEYSRSELEGLISLTAEEPSSPAASP